MVVAKLTYCYPAFRDRLHVRQIQPGHKGEIRGRKIKKASCVGKRTLCESAKQLWAILKVGRAFRGRLRFNSQKSRPVIY